MDGFLILIGVILILIGAAAYFGFIYFIRPKFPVTVTCWFCGKKTSVPYGNKNCWDCLSCDQYNGFTEDGDYNKPIPSQYDDRLNHPVSCDEDEFISGNNILCRKCTQNQLLKVKQLANFIPYQEKNYSTEVEAFERHLEKVYKLCMSCQMRVQQELQVQNEAISSRLSHLDESVLGRSFTGEENVVQEPVRIQAGHWMSAGRVLHAMSFACSIALLLRQINLTSEDWPLQQYRLSLHPLLELLDRHSDVLAIVGLFAVLAAKLVIGKYRLYIVDAVSCPLWLLVLLIQAGFLQLGLAGSLYEVISCVANSITCGVCLGIGRRRTNLANFSMTRLTLDMTDSGQEGSISLFSSISQQGVPNQTSTPDNPRPTPDKDRPSISMLPGDGMAAGRHIYLDDTVAELDSISLGLPSKRTESASSVFSMSPRTSFQSNISSSQSIPDSLRHHRPLISPATFNHSSNTGQRPSHLKHGLFSVPTESSLQSFLDRPSTPVPKSFGTPSLFSVDRHSFTPERPSTPVITAFGETPFSVSGRSTPVGPSFGVRSFGSSAFSSRGSSFGTQGGFLKPQLRRRGDDDDDRASVFTSSQCAVDSTTSIQEKKGSFWRHPGFIGFILGGSVVANILLILHTLWAGQNSTTAGIPS